MYRSDLNRRDKSGAIAAVIVVHAALLFALLHASGHFPLASTQEVLRIFDVNEVPPPLPPPIRQPEQQKQKPKAAQGAASAKNIRSQATEVAAPQPRIPLPLPVPMAVSKTPNQGTQRTQGASNVVGPGTGAGGVGTGTGSGGAGAGTGGGGEGGAVAPPRLVTPVLRGRDFPPQILDSWPNGATVFLRLRVDARGYVSECTVDRGTGVAAIDSEMCNLAHDRLRFRPALNRSGQAVAGWFGYAQPAPR
jgi:protein TonB